MLVSFWCDFDVILASLGCLLATLGIPGTPRGGRVEKVAEKVVFGSSPGISFGDQIDKELGKSRSEKHVGTHCVQSAAQEVSWDPFQP